MRRVSDDVIYHFDFNGSYNDKPRYRREDNKDVAVSFDLKWGWVVTDAHGSEIMGRPWSVHFDDQKDHPPEGDWVSKKGPKSYVYELRYF